MQIAIPEPQLAALVARQIDTLFMLSESEAAALHKALSIALARTEHCFSATDNKYYRREGSVFFNPYHSAQYCIFLYYLSVAVARAGDGGMLADKLYYLNRSLNAVDLYYEVRLPDIFMLDHPLGSVMGRAQYGDYFRFAQACTVGNNHDRYPVIGRHVTMMSGSKIIGSCRIGDNVTIAANSYIKDTDIPPNSTVFGSSPSLVIKPARGERP